MKWRNSREYRIWRARVIRKHKKCIICGSKKHRIAHHVNHASYFKNDRFRVDNGVVFCSSCHMQFHNNFKSNTRKKCTRKDLHNFIALTKHFIGVEVCK
jgi:hypothetical protein